MSEQSRRLIFNRYAPPTTEGPAVHLYADTPVIALREGRSAARTAPQAAGLQATRIAAGQAGLNPSLEWAFCEYIVQRIGGPSNADLLGGLPEQPVSQAERASQLAAHEPEGGARLCLFNVLVAIEWHASPRFLRQLSWAFRLASDFLYDVTDGTMAFGQVVFGGPELMNGADIQIMASNRYHPRSWVDGLHNPHKYQAIRAGRGVWDKQNSVCIPWDEPEAYRTLVHEWGHYALALKDEYLAIDFAAPRPDDPTDLRRASPDDPAYRLCIPGISLALETIMSTLATSELMAQQASNSQERRLNEWGRLRSKPEFRFLNLPADHRPLDGPMRLPLPLPAVLLSETQAAPDCPQEYRLTLPASRIQLDHCWVYLHGKSGNGQPRLTVQGTVDARAAGDGFLLLGAAPGDAIILIGLTPAIDQQPARPVALRAAIAATQSCQRPDGHTGLAIPEESWQDMTPTPFPVIDVVPTADTSAEALRRSVQVQINGAPGSSGWRCTLFEAGGPAHRVESGQSITVGSLDGYVLAESEDGARLTISSFSQGGGPGTSPPVHANPTTAGSSEGNVMVFFHDASQGDSFYDEVFKAYEQRRELRDKYADLTIITTVSQAVTAPDGLRPRSYTFSFAANGPIPRLDPTLVMFYDSEAAQSGRLRVYRQAPDGGWVAVATYRPEGQSYVAVPLNGRSAPALFGGQGPWVERYRLYVPD